MDTLDGRELLKRVVRKGSTVALQALASEHERRVAEWYSLDLEEGLKYDFDLDERSTVLDVGGYHGQWASDIYSRYLSTIYVYEPVPEFASSMDERFRGNPNIIVRREGLAATTRLERLRVQDVASTAIVEGASVDVATAITVQFTAVTDAIDAIGAREIDLMALNIEGLEYEVLDALVVEEYIGRIRNLLIQFHDFVPGAEQRRIAIGNELNRTHERQFCVPFVWEGWRSRSSSRERRESIPG